WAGGRPTASAVLADVVDAAVVDAARGVPRPWFAGQEAPPMLDEEADSGRFYVRLMVADEAGVVARVADGLAREKISIASLLQHEAGAATSVPVMITTHHTRVAAMRRAVLALSALPFMHQPPCVMRIMDNGENNGTS
ncbi:MAG: ACT domain-containing protein, partial [Alphaproteobacteria bacterium]|nr:ACT domain-containing protein [Alphaproteobacteria bacterium]